MLWLKNSAQSLARYLRTYPAYFLVVMNPMDVPEGNVGEWNFSSAVAIAPNWAISAKHTWGDINSYLAFKGQQHQVVEIILHPIYDVQLIHFEPAVTVWTPIRSSLRYNDEIYFGGHGMQANVGEAWGYPREERWGTNKIASEGNMPAITYSRQSDSDVTDHEASCANNDSGSGFFKRESDGKLYLEALLVSGFFSTWGQSNFGDTCFGLNTSLFADWVYRQIDGGADADRNGIISIDDIFVYLNKWFARDPSTDFNANGCHQPR